MNNETIALTMYRSRKKSDRIERGAMALLFVFSLVQVACAFNASVQMTGSYPQKTAMAQVQHQDNGVLLAKR